MFKIFTFYRKDKSNTCIHIAALTVMEAANALYELDNFSQMHYNIHEFKMEHINVFPILNIDEDYSGLPYILSEEQYEYVVSEHRKQQKDDKFERNTIDKSNVKYNNSIPINTMYNAISRINKASNEYKIPLKNKLKVKKNDKEIKLDQSLNDTLNNLKNDTMDVLMKYMHQFNNKETRENICNDLTKLLTEKYSNLMNDIDEVEEKNKNTNKTKLIVDNALSMLQNKIKGEN